MTKKQQAALAERMEKMQKEQPIGKLLKDLDKYVLLMLLLLLNLVFLLASADNQKDIISFFVSFREV